MRYVSSNNRAKINSGHTTFATCYRITLQNGLVTTITDHDVDIKIGAETYISSVGVSATKITESDEFDPSNLELDVLLDGTILTVPILRSGAYSRATIQMFFVDFEAPPTSLTDPDIIWVKTGTVGNIFTTNKNIGKLEFRGFEQALKQNIVETGSRYCRATFGDNRCKINKASFTTTGTVISHNKKFVAVSFGAANSYYAGGYVELTSGPYSGAIYDIADNVDNNLVLLDLPLVSLTGYNIKCIAGCDKSINTCKNVFANVINFQGEPHVPTRDSAIVGKKAKTGSVNQSSSGGGK